MFDSINLRKDIIEVNSPDSCPYCSFDRFIKYGKKKDNRRYKCKSEKCGKTFSDNTNKLWSNSKKTIDIWGEFISLCFKGKTLSECSKKLGISVPTAHSWRIKVLQAISLRQKSKLSNTVGVHVITISENFKGNRDREIIKSKREKIFVAAAKDTNIQFYIKPISRYTISKNKIKENFLPAINPDSKFFVFGNRIFRLMLEDKFKNKSEYIKSREKSNDVAGVIKFSVGFKAWAMKFRGVATKYLDKYLHLYNCIFEANNNARKIDIIKIASCDSYITRKKYMAWSHTI